MASAYYVDGRPVDFYGTYTEAAWILMARAGKLDGHIFT